MDNTPVVQTTNNPIEQVPLQSSKNYLKFIIAGLIILFTGLFGGYYLLKSNSKPPVKGCTLEAKTCPDGSSVGRTGPNCEFSPCSEITTTQPSPTPDPTINWKTYTNINNLYSFKYPQNWFLNPNNGSEMLSDISLDGTGYPDYIVNFSTDISYTYRVSIESSSGTKKEIADKVYETKIADINVNDRKAAKFQIDVLAGSRTDAHNGTVVKLEEFISERHTGNGKNI